MPALILGYWLSVQQPESLDWQIMKAYLQTYLHEKLNIRIFVLLIWGHIAEAHSNAEADGELCICNLLFLKCGSLSGEVLWWSRRCNRLAEVRCLFWFGPCGQLSARAAPTVTGEPKIASTRRRSTREEYSVTYTSSVTLQSFIEIWWLIFHSFVSKPESRNADLSQRWCENPNWV